MIIPIAIKTVFFLKLLGHIENRLGCIDNCFLTTVKSKENKPVQKPLKFVLQADLKNEKVTF